MRMKSIVAALMVVFAFSGILRADDVSLLPQQDASAFSHVFTGADIYDSAGSGFQNGWNTLSGGNSNNIAYVTSGSLLNITTTGTTQTTLDGTQSSNGSEVWGDVNGGTQTVEISMRFNNINNGMNVFLGNDTDRMIHSLYTNEVKITANGGGYKYVPATLNDGEFHTLRFALDGSSKPSHVWLDGVLISDVNGGVVVSSANETRFLFGDTTSQAFGNDLDIDIASISYTDGAYAPVQTEVAINSFTADRTDVFPSDNVVALSWTVVNETSLVLEPGSIDVLGTSTLDVSPVADTTYSLIAGGGGLSVTNTIDINVITNDPVINSFTAGDTNVWAGNTVPLTWDIEDATSLSIDQGVGDVTGLTTVDVVVNGETTYTITASNENGDTLDSVSVTLLDATVLWRRDWEQLAHDTIIDDTNLDGGPVSAVEVGTQDFTVVGDPMRVFNSDDVGGFDLISTSNVGVFTNIIEITDVQYAALTEHNLEFVIGTGSFSGRDGAWFVEFGTMSGTVFTPLPGVDSGSATYDFDSSVGGTLEEDENFNDDTNYSGLFGYNVGGRLQTLTVDATDAVNGQNIAIRMGISSSATWAGYTDMMLTSSGAALVPVGEITITTLTGDEVGISWDTTSGQAYNVLTNGNLVSPSWDVLNSVIGDGGNITVTSATAQAELFYKVTSE